MCRHARLFIGSPDVLKDKFRAAPDKLTLCCRRLRGRRSLSARSRPPQSEEHFISFMINWALSCFQSGGKQEEIWMVSFSRWELFVAGESQSKLAANESVSRWPVKQQQFSSSCCWNVHVQASFPVSKFPNRLFNWSAPWKPALTRK